MLAAHSYDDLKCSQNLGYVDAPLEHQHSLIRCEASIQHVHEEGNALFDLVVEHVRLAILIHLRVLKVEIPRQLANHVAIHRRHLIIRLQPSLLPYLLLQVKQNADQVQVNQLGLVLARTGLSAEHAQLPQDRSDLSEVISL